VHSVTYWTGVWDPQREALSNEVARLRATLAPGALVFSLSRGQRFDVQWRERVLKTTPRQFLLFAALAAIAERRTRVSHAIGAVDGWHLLRCLGRRPLLFTVAIDGHPLSVEFYDRVALFVAETESLALRLRSAGIADERIAVLPPGIRLDRFTPSTLPQGPPWRILFASTPSDPGEIAGRGIPLLIELARQRGDIEVRLVWRPWGDTVAAKRALEALDPPPNVTVHFGDVADMGREYAAAHIVACPFTQGFGKAAPNSVIEGLACGRPALVSAACGLAQELQEGEGGSVFRLPSGLNDALESLLTNLEPAARNARRLAQSHFDEAVWLRKYAAWYADLAKANG
jgi:glycosyltransferase involved in cell wall biosynthesis